MPKLQKKRRIPDAGARGTRTTIQVAVAAFLVNLWSVKVSHLSAPERALYVVVLTGVITTAWVAIENRWGKAFLRTIPEPDAPLIDTDKPEGPSTGAEVVAGVRARRDAPVVRIHPDDLAGVVQAITNGMRAAQAAAQASAKPAPTKRTPAKKTTPRKRTGQ